MSSGNVLFIISSAIHITNHSLSYTSQRSAFNTDERARQTLKTIHTIRTIMPEAKILLIETGLSKDLPYNIAGKVDDYLYLGHRKIMREAADGPHKGLGEAISLYLAHRNIQKFNADYFFKLSGRYFLGDHFDFNDWSKDHYTGKDGYAGGLYTVLYGFPVKLYENWRHSLKSSMPALLQGVALEVALPSHFTRPIHYLKDVGASGWVSHSGQFISM